MKKHIFPAGLPGFVLTASLIVALGLTAGAQQQKPTTPPTLKSILLAQFRQTWHEQDWFVPVKQGLQGITAEQAIWKASDSSHSIGELAYHILFWNKRSLDKFNNQKSPAFDGNNNETFTAFTAASWASTVQQLDQCMKDWETAIEKADEAKLKDWYDTLAHINIHTAYHTGQILFIRKLAGNWDSKKGVH